MRGPGPGRLPTEENERRLGPSPARPKAGAGVGSGSGIKAANDGPWPGTSVAPNARFYSSRKKSTFENLKRVKCVIIFNHLTQLLLYYFVARAAAPAYENERRLGPSPARDDGPWVAPNARFYSSRKKSTFENLKRVKCVIIF